MKIRTLSGLALTTACLVAAQSSLGVTITDTFANGATEGASGDIGGANGYVLTPTGFTAAGSDKLVLVFSGHDGNTGGNPTVASVTYNGVTMTEAVQDRDNGNIVVAGVWYLDNVASDGDLRIELTGTSSAFVHAGFGLYAVDGLLPGVADTGSARSNGEVAALNHASDINTADGFFVQEGARNNQSFSDTGGDDYLTLYNISVDSYRGYSQYRVITGDGPGTFNAPVGNGGDNFKRIVSAGFDAVPEPSSLALLGIGGLLVARRRRD